MAIKDQIINTDKLDKARQTLKAIRKFQHEQFTLGIRRVDNYIEDVDGDWLEKWGEEEAEESPCD